MLEGVVEDLKLPLPPLVDSEGEVPLAGPIERESTQRTARRAIEVLLNANEGFVDVQGKRQALAVAFAIAGKIVYGKAFDIARVAKGVDVDLNDPNSIGAHMKDITLYEVKSTNRTAIEKDFEGYFFSMSTAELLVAQSLGDQFKFMFVNVETGHRKEMSLRDIYRQARAIYPVWSISLGKAHSSA